METIKHRGFNIKLEEPNPDRVTWKITRLDGSVIEHKDAVGFANTVEDALDVCRDAIDDWLDNDWLDN